MAINFALQYIEDVLSGKVLTGELVKLAVERHVRELDYDWDYYFDEAEAMRVIKFSQICRHWKGEWAGKPITLEPHQWFYLWVLYGWRRKDGLRRFNRAFKMVARKNAKTTEAAIRILYHLLYDNENGPQVYAAATKEDQATIVINDAGQIVNRTPELREYFKLFKARDKIKRVVKTDLSGFACPIGADSDTQDGFDPSWGVIDEYHAHKTAALYNIIRNGQGSRQQPMIEIITTAGFNKDGPCYSVLRKTSIDVLKGILTDDNLFAMIYELDEGDDWHDEKNWIKANPNLGVSVKWDFIRSRYLEAQNEGGATEVDFLTKNLNYWTDSYDTWITDETWQRGNQKVPELNGAECYAGLDLAEKIDVTSFTMLFPVKDTIYVKSHHWIPEDTARKYHDKYNVDWHAWDNVSVTEGSVLDYDYIYNHISDMAKKYVFKSIGYDPHMATQLIVRMEKDKFPCVPVSQGMINLSYPTKEWGDLVTDGKLVHGGDPVLRWMNGNIVIYKDANNNIKVHKGKSQNKVDGIVAGIVGLWTYLNKEEGLDPFVNPVTNL